MQIRQAIHQQQQQQQQHQQQQQQSQQQLQGQSSQQLSTSSGVSPVHQQHQQSPVQAQQQNPGAGSSTLANPNLAALAALGPSAVQNFQMLQNPSHPFVQYMAQAVPGFLTFPVQQQLQRMQQMQASDHF
jgi:hypothetical protein